MDEPLSNLDAKLRMQTRGEILDLQNKIKRTVVYVTHDQVEAMTMGDRIAVMNDGIIQQIDIPELVYNRPVNRFVAGFIGAPPMNFFDCTLAQRGAGLVAVCDGISINLPGAVVTDAVKARVGQPVVLGIRPENIVIADGKAADFTARVDVVEGLGAEQLVTACVNGQEFMVKVAGDSEVETDEDVGFVLDSAKVHIFDKETGANISL